jgi:hypothetical protein
MNAKTETIRFLATPEFKTELRNAAENLNMSMSDLVRDAVYKYIDSRVVSARNLYMGRIAKFMDKENFDHAVGQLEASLKGMSLQAMETWGNPELVADDMFEQFINIKLERLERTKEPVTA